VVFDEELELATLRRKAAGRGRLRSGETSTGRGRYVRSSLPGPGERAFEVAVDATLRAAASRGPRSEDAALPGPGFLVEPGDLRRKVRTARGNRLVVFLVDASDSMDSSSQLGAAKGAVLSLLAAAYVRRDRVGLVAFRDEKATVLLPPTSSVHLARERLKSLSAGGATPLAAGLLEAWKLVRSEKLKEPGRKTVLVLLSDGESNVPLTPGADRAAEIEAIAGLIRKERIHTVFVDTNPPEKPSDAPRKLAAALSADYRRISRVRAGQLLDIVEE